MGTDSQMEGCKVDSSMDSKSEGRSGLDGWNKGLDGWSNGEKDTRKQETTKNDARKSYEGTHKRVRKGWDEIATKWSDGWQAR